VRVRYKTYVIEAGYFDEPTFFRLLFKSFPEATTFYVDGTGITKDVVACYESYAQEGEYLPLPNSSDMYRCSFSQELMDKLALLSERHFILELLDHLHLYKQYKPLVEWHDAFCDHSEIKLSGSVPKGVVSMFAKELGPEYRVISFAEDWSVHPERRKNRPQDRTSIPTMSQI
jgi:hypothetical protein